MQTTLKDWALENNGDEYDLDVDFTLFGGTKDTRDEPGEPLWCEILSIIDEADEDRRELINILTDTQLAAISDEIVRQAKAGDYQDYPWEGSDGD